MSKTLEDFIQNLDQLTNKLKPVITKVMDPKGGVETKHGMTYMEMKYNLLSHYC